MLNASPITPADNLEIRQIDSVTARDFLAADPELWEAACMGLDIPKDYNLRPGSLFFGGFVGRLIGLLWVHDPGPDNRIHFYVSKPYRRDYARALFERSMAPLLRRWPLYAEIPLSRLATINFTRRHNFQPISGGEPGFQLLVRQSCRES